MLWVIHMRLQLFTEVGLGNRWIISTEIESESTEIRVPHAVYGRTQSIYVRLWIGKRVLIIDSADGIKSQRKDRKGMKVLIGVRSVLSDEGG